jgi:flavin-dependent dehydrogenase
MINSQPGSLLAQVGRTARCDGLCLQGSQKTAWVADHHQRGRISYPFSDERCHLWFFEDGLPGYAWYVPKADGYLNVGIGGSAHGG